MSKQSFKLYAIEKYADKKNIPSNEIFSLFYNNGVLKMLDEDYEMIHGFGFEYIIQDIDKYLEGDNVSMKNNTHGTIRAATLKDIIPMIEKRFSVSEIEAMKMFYESNIGKQYSDNESGLYGQSALYITSLLEAEIIS